MRSIGAQTRVTFQGQNMKIKKAIYGCLAHQPVRKEAQGDHDYTVFKQVFSWN